MTPKAYLTFFLFRILLIFSPGHGSKVIFIFANNQGDQAKTVWFTTYIKWLKSQILKKTHFYLKFYWTKKTRFKKTNCCVFNLWVYSFHLKTSKGYICCILYEPISKNSDFWEAKFRGVGCSYFNTSTISSSTYRKKIVKISRYVILYITKNSDV